MEAKTDVIAFKNGKKLERYLHVDKKNFFWVK